MKAASRVSSVEFDGNVVTDQVNPEEPPDVPVSCIIMLTWLSLQYCSVVPFATRSNDLERVCVKHLIHKL